MNTFQSKKNSKTSGEMIYTNEGLNLKKAMSEQSTISPMARQTMADSHHGTSTPDSRKTTLLKQNANSLK